MSENVVHVLPLCLAARFVHAFALGPVLQLVSHEMRHPHSLTSVTVGLRGEPARLMGRELAAFAFAASSSLVLFLQLLQRVGPFVLAVLERALVGTETAVCWSKNRFEVVRTVVQCNGEWREVEGHRRLRRITPQKDVLRTDRWRRRLVNRNIWMQVAVFRARCACDKLAVPAARNIKAHFARRIDDAACNFEGVLPAPATGLERENTGITSLVVLDLYTGQQASFLSN